MRGVKKLLTAVLAAVVGVTAVAAPVKAETKELLNVSYDPTLYAQYNELFAKHWKEKTGQEVKIKQSHGGSGKQARARDRRPQG